MSVEYEKDERQKLLDAIIAYWHDEFDEDIGVIRSEAIFEFFNGLVGAAAYNNGVLDAQAYIQGRLLDMDADLYEDVVERPPR